MIETAEITAPNSKNFTINSKNQKVIEISRRELDKQIAFQAQKNGATIKVRTSFQEIIKQESCKMQESSQNMGIFHHQ